MTRDGVRRRAWWRAVAVACVLALLGARGAAAEGIRARRIVLLGDSVTYGYALDRTYGQILGELLAARGRPALVVNAGINGNTTEQGRARFERDVLARRPDLVAIEYGLNDQAVRLYRDPAATAPLVPRERFVENLRHFVRELRRRGIVAVLVTPNPMVWTPELARKNPDGPFVAPPDGGNRRLEVYVEAIRTLAREENAPLVDFYRMYSARGSLDDLFLPDGVHPNEKAYGMNARALADVIVPPGPASRQQPEEPPRRLRAIDRGTIRALCTRGRGWREETGHVLLERLDERGNPLDRITLPVALGSRDFRLRARIEVPGGVAAPPILVVGGRRFTLGGTPQAGTARLEVALDRPIALEVARRNGTLTIASGKRRLVAEPLGAEALPVVGFEPGRSRLRIHELDVTLTGAAAAGTARGQ
jgi:lysophospholipase L1-like esterase